ncbi:hypothetical protein [Prevotella sp. E2-28]|uniref:hypothetical protein n=1 Tax=Prevotella sp. E2-28 TaxID=2913620 RepID=UPI001EDC81D4|nr:hypothetical protein [Prevotella sp. E2-28]UKK52685.1 hypothetical protein L6465_08715 [Prevotella sp. E2-28]
MEENKKRWCPSLTAYRELEEKNRALNEIVAQLGNVSEVVRENIVLRQAMMNFHTMIKSKKDPAILVQCGGMADSLIQLLYNDIKECRNADMNSLRIENKALSKYKVQLEEEIEKLRESLSESSNTIQAMDKEIYALCHRNLLERILNK